MHKKNKLNGVKENLFMSPIRKIAQVILLIFALLLVMIFLMNGDSIINVPGSGTVFLFLEKNKFLVFGIFYLLYIVYRLTQETVKFKNKFLTEAVGEISPDAVRIGGVRHKETTWVSYIYSVKNENENNYLLIESIACKSAEKARGMFYLWADKIKEEAIKKFETVSECTNINKEEWEKYQLSILEAKVIVWVFFVDATNAFFIKIDIDNGRILEESGIVKMVKKI